jgi:hypothetical protein
MLCIQGADPADATADLDSDDDVNNFEHMHQRRTVTGLRRHDIDNTMQLRHEAATQTEARHAQADLLVPQLLQTRLEQLRQQNLERRRPRYHQEYARRQDQQHAPAAVQQHPQTAINQQQLGLSTGKADED